MCADPLRTCQDRRLAVGSGSVRLAHILQRIKHESPVVQRFRRQRRRNSKQPGAAGAVNRYLTMRNWLIGAYVVELSLRRWPGGARRVTRESRSRAVGTARTVKQPTTARLGGSAVAAALAAGQPVEQRGRTG